MIQQAARPVKNLDTQRAERRERAEREFNLYAVSLRTMKAVCKRTGRDLSQTVATVRKLKADRRGMVMTYTITEHGCNCPDALQAKQAGIQRACKHEHLLKLHLQYEARMAAMFDPAPAELMEQAREMVDREFAEVSHPDPAPYLTEEESANETLLRAERRAEIRRRMDADFGNF